MNVSGFMLLFMECPGSCQDCLIKKTSDSESYVPIYNKAKDVINLLKISGIKVSYFREEGCYEGRRDFYVEFENSFDPLNLISLFKEKGFRIFFMIEGFNIFITNDKTMKYFDYEPYYITIFKEQGINIKDLYNSNFEIYKQGVSEKELLTILNKQFPKENLQTIFDAYNLEKRLKNDYDLDKDEYNKKPLVFITTTNVLS